MLKQTSSKATQNHQSDFAPALDSDPVFERPGEGRWEIAPRTEPFTPFAPTAAGPWADTRSAFDVGHGPGPGFLDPGTHALANHVAPMLASESMHFGALAGASSDLVRPVALEAPPAPVMGGGDDDGDETLRSRRPRK